MKKKREKEKKVERKVESLFIKESEVERTFLARQPMYFFFYNNICYATNSDPLPSGVNTLL